MKNVSQPTKKPTKFKPTLWRPITLIFHIISDDAGKVTGGGCVVVLLFWALATYINNLVLDYMIWFFTGQHLPTWMNLVLGFFLGYFSGVIYLLGFICLALQHLNLFPIPVVHH